MLRSIAVTATLSLALAAQANDGVELSLRNKALVSAASTISTATIKHADAPFSLAGRDSSTRDTTTARDPLPQLLLLDEQDRHGLRGTCDYTSRDLCYDLADGRVVYRAARNYMPSMAGLTADSVSLRRNRIVFKYTFK
jgi:hypothetical protein